MIPEEIRLVCNECGNTFYEADATLCDQCGSPDIEEASDDETYDYS
jgi:rRNA maturation endonuclease Nob1|tara:strand:+ start:409 stop:546 length:138 start_codon:yes stop_codon:yes gene_type:complete